MKKLIALALAAVLGCSALVACPSASLAQKTYVNGIDPNYPPFAYIDEKTGKAAGFDVDSMNWIAEKMGFKVEHKPMAWDSIIPSLLARQIDMVDSGMSITEKRREQVDFSEPYWQVYHVFVVRKDSSLTHEEILSKPIKLGVQRGTSEADAIKTEAKEKGYPFEMRAYDSCPLAVEDLLNGRIDAAYMDSLPAEDAISKGRAVKIVCTHGEPDGFGVAVRKGDAELNRLIIVGYRRRLADPFWMLLLMMFEMVLSSAN